MTDLLKFIREHQEDDVTKLILNRNKWPGIDIELAVNTIVSRRKLRSKLDSWAEHPDLIFPSTLSVEQCSSEETALYKTKLAERIATSSEITTNSKLNTKAKQLDYKWTIADLTGGLGVDTWYFSQKASKVLYNEMQTPLYKATKYNLCKLGATNIIYSNKILLPSSEINDFQKTISRQINVQEDSLPSSNEILGDFKPTIIYLDPARRGEGGKKVFLLEDCSPDVLSLKSELFQYSRHILLKLSPMADITMLIESLGVETKEFHVVSVDGECKEILVWMDREYAGVEPLIVAYEEKKRMGNSFEFFPSEEKKAIAKLTTKEELGLSMHSQRLDGNIFLFEPNKSLMKAGAFNLIAEKFGINKLGNSTHFYIHQEMSCELLKYGKLNSIHLIYPFNNKTIRSLGQDYPEADLTARNLPITTEQLRKKMGLDNKGKKNEHESKNHAHIYALKVDLIGNLFFVTINN